MHYKANTLGFYVPGGSAVNFMENSRERLRFLEEIRGTILTMAFLWLWACFLFIKQEQTRLKAKALGICLAYLPPYSLDLTLLSRSACSTCSNTCYPLCGEDGIPEDERVRVEAAVKQAFFPFVNSEISQRQR